MSAGVLCSLLADGVKVADGSPTDDPDDPAALSGLSLTWGRSTTVDQPDVSTLTFTLADTPGGLGVRDVLAVGTPLQVTATGTTYPDPTVSTFPDPGFEAGPPNLTAVVGAQVARDTTRAHAGAASARMRSTTAGVASAVFAPLPFAVPGTDPGAWDAIPAAQPGQRWQAGAWVWAPVGVQVSLAPVQFTAPYAGAAVIAAPIASVAGAGAWVHLQAAFTPTQFPAWVGVQVLASPAVTWNATPGTWDDQAGNWDDRGTVWVDDLAVLAPAAGVPRTVLVYSGRVSNLVADWPDGSTTPLVEVTAVDFTADLANRDVGDQPWLVEPMSAPVARIVALAAPGLPVTIDPTVAAIPVSWRDVDSQPATGLLQDLAASVDAILWPATHAVSGPYVDIEDPGLRPPDRVLVLVGGVVVIVESTAGRLAISACDVARDPVRFTQDVGDVVTRAAIGWLIQGVDEDGLPTTTEATYTLIDPIREADGTRRYGISTQLTTQADAANVAARVMARTGQGWRASGLQVDDSEQVDLPAESMLTLLDGTSRNGLPLSLTDVPAWSPVGPTIGLYLEGGTFRFESGWWVLDLTVSSAESSGQSVKWNDPPAAWTWNTFDPSITWDSLTGVGVAA